MATLTLLVSFGGVTALSFFMYAGCLRLGAAWAKIPDATFARVLFATLVIQLAGVVVSLLSVAIEGRPGVPVAPMYFVLLVVQVALQFALVAVILKASWRQAIKAWLVTLVSPLVLVVFIHFLFRPFGLEAFKTTGNSMAPTLLGEHWQGVCPHCGQPAFASPTRPGEPVPPNGVLMICSHCLRTSSLAGSTQTTLPGDRFAVNKFLPPRRWDIIAFRYPADPATTFVKRLVGLPGETIFIQDGAVWINGQRIEPPEPLRGIQYLDKMDGLPQGAEICGSKNKPAVLGKDEYFVLGDFSARAKDSRLWDIGAPGHAPYAVPVSYVLGVVTHIYWPPNRCRVLR